VLLGLIIGLAGCVETGDLGHDETTPSMNFLEDEANDRVIVQSTSDNADWRGLALRTTMSGLRFALNEQPAPGAQTLAAGSWTPVASQAQSVNAGEFIAFCATGGPRDAVTLDMNHVATDTAMGSFQFTTIESC
jgi:hypothetical protein